MTLKTTIKAVGPYKGKSKFEFWNIIDPGDEIEVSYAITRSRRNYAPKIKLKLLKNNWTFTVGAGQFNNYIYNLEYTEI